MSWDQDELYRPARDADYRVRPHHQVVPRAPSPGKVSLTSRLAPRIMREAAGGSALAPDAADQVDRASTDAGTPLPDSLRQPLEQQLGAELSGVRVHTSGASQDAARGLRANAYTLGQDIHFAAGTYAPETSAGQRLIAHEVAHTVQQRNASPRPQASLEVSQPGDAHEREADAFADSFVGGMGNLFSLSPVAAGSVSRQVVQRDGPTGNDGGTTVNTDQEVEIDFGGGKKIKITGNSLQGTVAFDEIKFPKEDFEKSHRFQPLTFCPGVYGYIAVGCSAGVTDNVTVTVSGTKSGEGDNATWSLTVSGENIVKGEAKAWMSLGLAAGLPGIANLSAEAAAIPTAALEARHGVTGALTWSKSAGVGGYVEFPMKVNGTLDVELALRLMYEVFWKDHPTEFAKYTVGKWEIATASMEGTPRYTIGQGFSADVIEPTIKWGGKPKPTHIGGRAAAEQAAEYQRRKDEYDRNTAGASGAPGYHPDDDFRDENVLIDDGQGVSELKPAEDETGGSSSGGGGMSVDPGEGGMSIDPGEGGVCTPEDPDGDGVPG